MPRAPSAATSLADGEDERGRARHVVDDREPRAIRGGGEDRRHDLVGRAERKRNGGDHDPGSGAVRDPIERVSRRVVGVIGGQQLVARPEVERGSTVFTRPSRWHEREVVGSAAHECGEDGTRLVERGLELADEEAHGLRSIRARQAAWASSTARGAAPYEPWLRKVTAGSSVQSSANGDG